MTSYHCFMRDVLHVYFGFTTHSKFYLFSSENWINQVRLKQQSVLMFYQVLLCFPDENKGVVQVHAEAEFDWLLLIWS